METASHYMAHVSIVIERDFNIQKKPFFGQNK